MTRVSTTVWAFALALGLALGIPSIAEAKNGTISGSVTAKKAKYKKNTVVYLKKVPGKHKPPKKAVKIDQRGQKFIPFVLPIVKGTTVSFLNNDNTGHNVFSPDGEKYDLGTWDKGETREHKFTKEGVYTQLCHMHPSMIAYILVLQNPFFATTSKDGSFTIKDVPPGTYELAVWNERKKAKPQSVTVTAGNDTKVEIKLGK